jgi:hypothetical protein
VDIGWTSVDIGGHRRRIGRPRGRYGRRAGCEIDDVKERRPGAARDPAQRRAASDPIGPMPLA